MGTGAAWPRSDPTHRGDGYGRNRRGPADAPPRRRPSADGELFDRRAALCQPRRRPDQDYLADGITEDLTATLGRLPRILVIGHGTAFPYKGRAVDARQVGRELGVHYVVEGSVRRLGEQLRVNARLSEAGSGGQLWAESLDEPLADLAGLTRLVTLRIARALDDRLYAAAAKRVRMERPKDPKAVDLVLRARALFELAALPRKRCGGAEGCTSVRLRSTKGLGRRAGRSRPDARGYRPHLQLEPGPRG